MPPNGRLVRGARRVKTGCRTCRIRKIKCDEGRPACQKCVTTGRCCDGYSGRVGCAGDSFSLVPGISLYTGMLPTAAAELDADERHAFEWLVRRTVTKIPGLFVSEFWQILVLQACTSDRAVLHAALALAAAHEAGMNQPDRPEQFILRQYNKAISRLLPILSMTDETSVRVALISSLVFAGVEFLQRRYKIGQSHLRFGRNVLRHARGYRFAKQDIAPQLQAPTLTDSWLIDAFERLSLQASLLTNMSSISPPEVYVPSAGAFQSVNQARKSLDNLLCRAYRLAQFRQRPPGRVTESSTQHFTAGRRQIQTELSMWLQATTLSDKGTLTRNAIGYQQLRIYHTMACILVGSAAEPQDEMLMDRYTSHFESILSQVRELLRASEPLAIADAASKMSSRHFSFTIDMGIIPPLYFVAVKCRVPPIRRQAVDLLSSASYQEGVWDGTTAAAVATEIMRLEGHDPLSTEPASLSHVPEAENVVPGTRRLYGVCVELPDTPDGILRLTAHRRRRNGSWQVVTGQLHLVPETSKG